MSKTNVKYTAEMRAVAKAAGKGLITLQYIGPQGGGITFQGPATAEQIKRVRDFLLVEIELVNKVKETPWYTQS